MKLTDVIKKVVVTEKALGGQPTQQYVFEVDRTATKPQIRQAVQELLGVKVQAVRTHLLPAKRRRNWRARGAVTESGERKKAVVTLAEGQKLELVEGV